MSRRFRGRRWLAVLACIGLSAGCLQIETRVKLHEDGSATITERLRFSKRLLDLASKTKGAEGVASLLTRDAVLARVGHMGEGAKLVSHKAHEAPKGAQESVSVIRIADFRKFRYVSPYLANYKYPKHNVLKCDMFPIYESTWYGRVAGQVAVTFRPATGERPPRRPKDWKPPKPPTPRDLQVFRDLRPVFRDLMQDFKLRLVFESYAPLRFRQYYRYRGSRAGIKIYDLIDFSDRNLDKYGFQFLGNEEIMLELLRLQMQGGNVVGHTKGHADNLTLPVYHPRGIPEVYFRPSQHFFDRHFKGKTLKFTARQGGPRLANFKQIGHHPRSGKKNKK